MSKRITQKILLKKLEILCRFLGKTVGYKEGQWDINYAQCYGGYIVVEYGENGGEHHPLLNKRLTAQQMSDCLDTAIQMIHVMGE